MENGLLCVRPKSENFSLLLQTILIKKLSNGLGQSGFFETPFNIYFKEMAGLADIDLAKLEVKTTTTDTPGNIA